MIRSIFFILCFSSSLFCEQGPKPGIVVENRVLATVRDHVITMYDVMKKLDMVFYQSYPQYKNSVEARMEFYKIHWRKMLEDLVDRELVLSYAEEKQFQVSHGDIRQELEESFGPEVMMSLYESGLSLQEVQEMIRADILLRRMIYFYVQKPVLSTITPGRVREAYAQKVKDSMSKEVFTWKTISIKAKEGDCQKKDAEGVLGALRKGASPEDVCKNSDTLEVVVSQPFQSERREIAPHVFTVLEPLTQGAYSELLPGKEQKVTWRSYYVAAREQKPYAPLVEVEETLRGELASPEIESRTVAFFDDLRKQYHVKQLFSSEELLAFDPFSVGFEEGIA